MVTNLSRLEIKIGERVYHLLCDVNSPLGEVYDALSAMKGFVANKITELEKVGDKQDV